MSLFPFMSRLRFVRPEATEGTASAGRRAARQRWQVTGPVCSERDRIDYLSPTLEPHAGLLHAVAFPAGSPGMRG